MKIRENSEWN